MGSIGTVLYSISIFQFSFLNSAKSEVIGSILIGLAFIILLLKWASAFIVLKEPKNLRKLLSNILLNSLIIYFLVIILPGKLSGFLFSALPIFFVLLINSAGDSGKTKFAFPKFDNSIKIKLQKMDYFSLSIIVFSLWIAFSFYRVFIWPSNIKTRSSFIFSAGIAILIFFFMTFLKIKKNYESLHSLLITIIALFCISYGLAFGAETDLLKFVSLSIIFSVLALTQLFILLIVYKIRRLTKNFTFTLLLSYFLLKGMAVIIGANLGTYFCFASNHNISQSIPFLLISLLLLALVYAEKSLRILQFETSPCAELMEIASINDLTEDEKKCLFQKKYLLSERETKISFLMYKGFSRKEIRMELGISEGTVNSHINNIYKKTSVHSQVELMNKINSLEDN